MILNPSTDPLPIGFSMEDGRFLCINCAPDDVLDNEENTPVFDYDEWFEGEICVQCHELIERKS